jgi:hypothetical protein
MNFTREDWVKLLVPPIIGAGILTVLVQFVVREWYSPDVRYATGGAYISSTLAISSLGLRNFGHADAENVIITASFADPITSISTDQTDQLAIPFESSAGGIGEKVVIGAIKRIRPAETVNVYFLLEPSSRWADYKQFIRDIKFNHGHGKTGTPVLTIWVPALLVAALFWGLLWIPLHYFLKRFRRPYENRIREAIRLGISAAKEGLSSEQLDVQVEERRKKMPFLNRPLKRLLSLYAHTAFEETKQNPA